MGQRQPALDAGWLAPDLPFECRRRARPLVQTPFDEGGAQFSPDGRWIAYQSNQSGGWEIYVQSLDGNSGRVQVSHGGGVRPLWHPSGRSLTFLKERDLMRVSFDAAEPRLAVPVKLFALHRDDLLLDVLPDGRFVVLRRAPIPSTTAVNVVANWFTLIREMARP